MVKKILLVLSLTLFAFAASIQDRVAHIVGSSTYNKNRAILNAVFMHTDKFRTPQGTIDTQKIVDVLKRLGMVKLRYPEVRTQSLEFIAYSHPGIFFYKVFDALSAAAVINYSIDRLVRNSDGYAIKVQFQAAYVPDPSTIVKVFQDAGLSVVDIVHNNRSWKYYINAINVHLHALEVDSQIQTGAMQKPVWVHAKGSISIHSLNGNHWSPAVFVYDKFLHPIKVIKKNETTKTLDIPLPKGDYYIKIADKFTIKNLRNGLQIVAR
ncbi:hypothetical protein [Nitratiruptor sp. YY09-18]|uniref:hypothetical protein n=1 Tax=Nitratiruptor sp. YY09-18 TaxID=2724901 RepID=UPI0019155B61|nr:hypothetical protein [Nitratiruptor sp. YY09-18]BCD68661.1 hypothetical protein NitYY0918_C1578 [Nitratiruptor sp. YY09-18]